MDPCSKYLPNKTCFKRLIDNFFANVYSARASSCEKYVAPVEYLRGILFSSGPMTRKTVDPMIDRRLNERIKPSAERQERGEKEATKQQTKPSWHCPPHAGSSRGARGRETRCGILHLRHERRGRPSRMINERAEF